MIDIVIVNYNTGALLQKCLESIYHFCGDLNCSIIVIDNASHDGSADFLVDDQRVTLFLLEHNIGFAAACNLGAYSSTSKNILFLNPDAVFIDSSLSDSAKFLDKNPNVGIIGPKVFNEQLLPQDTCFHFPTPLRLLADSTAISRIFEGLGARMKYIATNKPEPVDQVIGAYFLVKRSLFEQLYGFDEKFFVYYEEVDFCFRAYQAGFKTIYFPSASILHYGCISSKKVRVKSLFYLLRSRLIYSRKHFSSIGFLAVFATTLLIEIPLRILSELFSSVGAVPPTIQVASLLVEWLLNKDKFSK